MTAARFQRLIPLVLAGLVVLSAVGVGVLGWRAFDDRRAQQARDAALAAARTETGQVLSYSPATLQVDLAAARKVVSGSFAARFDELANTVITPAVTERKLSTKATVTNAAVIDAQPDQLRALLFVKQTTSMDGQPAPHDVTNQVKVTMTWSNGRWLISDLQPL